MEESKSSYCCQQIQINIPQLAYEENSQIQKRLNQRSQIQNKKSDNVIQDIAEDQSGKDDNGHFHQIDSKPQRQAINCDEIIKQFKLLQQASEGPSRKPKKKIQTQQIPQRKIQFSYLDPKVRQNINKMVECYRNQKKPSKQDSERKRVGYQYKQKLFLYLQYGIQQIKLVNCEQNIIKLTTNLNDRFKTIQKLVQQVDQAMVKRLNKGTNGSATRQYRLQWSNLISNIRDQKNEQLRMKILQRKMIPSEIPLMKQIEFYSTAKREQKLKKEKQYLAQCQAQIKLNTNNSQEPQILYSNNSNNNKIQILSKIPPAAKNSQIIFQLRNLIGFQNILKLKKRLNEDLTDKVVKNRLIDHLTKTFSNCQ